MTPDLTTWVQAVSAAVQALAAVAIVVLTVWLARTARNAFKASRDQADAAAAAIAEMEAQREEVRLQTRLSAVPLLSLDRPSELWQGHELFTRIRVTNATGTPALDVTIRIYGPILGHVYAWHRFPMVPPGEERWGQLESRELLNMGLTDEERAAAWSRGEVPPSYHMDRLTITCECRGLLGARVVQQFRWLANAADQGDDYVWRLMTLHVEPDDDPAHAIEVHLPD